MHMSIDIESLGTRPGSVIRSIGACLFNPASSDQQNAGLPVFYANISHRSCIEAGLTVDEGTVAWWRTQPRETVAALLPNQLPLREVLASFVQFWKETQAVHPWGYGANFDMVLIEEAIRRLNEKAVLQAKDDPLGDDVELIEVPWKYSNIRCARTLLALAAVDLKTFPRVGTAHHALDDARTQVNAISLAWRRLRRQAPEEAKRPADRGSDMTPNGDVTRVSTSVTADPTTMLPKGAAPRPGVTSDRPATLDGRNPFSLKPADDDDGPATQETRRQPVPDVWEPPPKAGPIVKPDAPSPDAIAAARNMLVGDDDPRN